MFRWKRSTQLLQKGWQLQQECGLKRKSTKLPVLLLEDVDSLGFRNTVAHVKPGYARNFLLPKKLATIIPRETSTRMDLSKFSLPDTPVQNQTTAKEATAEELEAAQQLEQQQLATKTIKRIVSKSLLFKRKTYEDDERLGELEEPINALDIAEEMKKQMSIDIDFRMLGLGTRTLNVVGEYTIPLQLIMPDRSRAQLSVTVASSTTLSNQIQA
jgi:large subunit ribosomal protein L9